MEVTILEHSVGELESTITVLEEEVSCTFLWFVVLTVLIDFSLRFCIRNVIFYTWLLRRLWNVSNFQKIDG